MDGFVHLFLSMIYNEEYFQLEESVDQLSQALLKSEIYQNYKKAEEKLKNKEVEMSYQAVIDAQKKFFQIAEYGKYAPGYKEARRAFYAQKRAYDCLPEVAAYRRALLDWQKLYYTVIEKIVHTIDESIMIEGGGLWGERNCKGNCHGHSTHH